MSAEDGQLRRRKANLAEVTTGLVGEAVEQLRGAMHSDLFGDLLGIRESTFEVLVFVANKQLESEGDLLATVLGKIGQIAGPEVEDIDRKRASLARLVETVENILGPEDDPVTTRAGRLTGVLRLLMRNGRNVGSGDNG